MTDQLVAEAANLHNTQQTQETNIHAIRGIRTSDPSGPATSDLHIRPNSHRGRQNFTVSLIM